MHLLELESLPCPEAFAELVAAERRASEEGRQHEQLKTHAAFDAVLRLGAAQREILRRRLRALADEADALAARREQWMDSALADVRSGRATVRRARGRAIGELVEACTPAVERLGAMTEVRFPDGDSARFVALAQEVRNYLDGGGEIKVSADGSPKVGAFSSKVLKQANRSSRKSVSTGCRPPHRSGWARSRPGWRRTRHCPRWTVRGPTT